MRAAQDCADCATYDSPRHHMPDCQTAIDEKPATHSQQGTADGSNDQKGLAAGRDLAKRRLFGRPAGDRD